MKTVILLLLLGIVTSLFSGLYYIGTDKSGTNRVVTALTLRIVLSLLVFGLLMGGHYFGWSTGGRL